MSFGGNSALNRLLGPIFRKISSVCTRVVVLRVDDSGKMQRLQCRGLSKEILDNLERPEEYGFASYPFEGAEGVAVFPQANREHGLIISLGDRRYRLQGMAQGEVALYTDEGDSIILRRGNRIEVNTALCEFSTDVKIKGNLEVLGTSLMRSTLTLQNADLLQTGANRQIRTDGTFYAETLIHCEGNIEGNSGSTAMSFNSIRNAYNAHTHVGQVPAPDLDI